MSVHTPYQKHTWVTKEIIRREYLQNIEDGIYQEQQDAEAAETALENALAAEEQRARSSETTIQNNLTAEITRATAAEEEITQGIQDDLDELSERISNEYTRATGVESSLQAVTTQNTTAIAAEVSRATQAESDLHDYVDQQVTRTYKPSGSIYFADLPALAASRLGNVYDIKDAFTTTSDFAEGAGKSYPIGTNVVIADIGNNTLKYDVLPGFIDTSTFYSTGDTNEATIADGDYFPFYDVSASAKKKTLWSNLKAELNIPGIATLLTAGIVKPDGTTITVDANGVLSSTGSSVSPQGLGFGYATCSTAAATTAKVATLTGYNLVQNGYVSVKFTNSVPASATLNINSKGAKAIYYHGAAITAGVIGAGDMATFVYDGTNYNLVGVDNVSSQIQTLEDETSDIVNVLGAKNILPITGVTEVLNGVTFTINSDNSVTVNGTATADIYYKYCANAVLDLGKSYIVNGCPNGGSLDTYYIYYRDIDNDTYSRDIGSGATFIAATESNNEVRIFIKSGVTVSLTFRPMIRPASIADDTYVPYAMTNRELTKEYAIKRTVPSLASGLINESSFIRKSGKVVELNITSDNNSNTLTCPAWGNITIATIPSGYRPDHNLEIPWLICTTAAEWLNVDIQITTTGNVVLFNHMNGKALTIRTIMFDKIYIV